MKLALSSFFLFLFFLCSPVIGNEVYNYSVKVSGIKIGELEWGVSVGKENYFNKLKLKSKGLLSGIYRFEGEYYSKGAVQDNKLKPKEYKHVWETNKVIKKMNLFFGDENLISLKQEPLEKERLRVNVFSTKHSKDPLSSFLQIIMGEKKSLVIDGRRKYTMNAVFNEETEQTVVEIADYFNLWADHKRSKFEKIIFEKKDGSFLPVKIHIHFDGRVFKLEQN